ncbi:Crp/Fnr family transcriptional regulator [Vagococcus vulneris]|uniref:Crp/Fnr family transcriptional regulator n=1 Tax=Vagococcus vulneris TaxID=1977869 RepID=A0A429ZZE6_9ENTE|nr:Crp/Fnr family transcriptional regulator [Vagococcus vulneris]RST99378.1 hypothetical protein CBF37_05250 [Vagococcus vulneris]
MCEVYNGCINLVPIFNHLNNSLKFELENSIQHRHLAKGEYLYQADDKDNTLYIVHKGQIRIFHVSESGKEQMIRVLKTGDFTGELTIFSENTYHDNFAEATCQTAVCLIKQSDLMSLLAANPKVTLKLLSLVAEKLQDSEKQMVSIATEPVINRIIYYLESLPHESDVQNDIIIDVPMNRQDLASYLGTTPETISRRFKMMEMEGLLQTLPKNRLLIHDMNRLLEKIE